MTERPALSAVYLSYLRTVQEIHEKKQLLQKCISDGFFLMAKARYIMGVERVSKTHYSPDMKATTMAYLKQDDDDNTVFDVSYEKPPVAYSDKLDTDESRSVRRRKNSSSESNDMNVHISISDLNLNDEDEINYAPDPLKWFGVLVPQALRDSQEKFKRATAITGEICTLNEKLKYYEKSISQLSTSEI